jgi:Putative transmembrane protein (PGPGW)
MTPRTEHHEGKDVFGGERPVERGSRRDRIRRQPGLRHAWRAGVFLAGLICIAGGFALAVLPGPLTIPPVLLGLWIWSTEFEWAHRMFSAFAEKARETWEHAKRHPVTSALVTGGGLVAAGVAIWAVNRYELVDRAKELVGLS